MGICWLLGSTSLHAASVLRFGQTAALEGPAKALGQDMRNGLLLAFAEANAAGGVQAQQLELISLDDQYEPDLAIDNTQQLIETHQVFGLIGTVGTPTANAILPIITRGKVPLIGPFTGAEILRSPYNPYVVNVRASYWQETEAWMSYLVDQQGLKEIAVLYQDDSFGRAGLSGVLRAMEKRQIKPVAMGTYRRNTTAIKTAALKIRAVKPQAVVMIGAYLPCSEFIKLSKELGVKAKFMNISFVGSDALAKSLAEAGEGVIISQVVPLPNDPNSQLAAHYQKVQQKFNPEAQTSFVSLEGYLVGRLNVEILKAIEGEITREKYIHVIQSKKTFTIEDITVTFDQNNNQGLDTVFLTEIGKDQNLKFIGEITVEQ